MTENYKSSKITFTCYLPDNKDDVWLYTHALDMYTLLYEIDQLCREIVKYENESIKNREALAEGIREMIHCNIDLNKIT